MLLQRRANHGGGAAEARARAGPVIARPIPQSSTPSTNGFPMTVLFHFDENSFSQDPGCEPPVRFDTAALSGLSPFATARTHCRDGLLLSAAFARKHARTGDVSN
jgi:hypothetical protein